MERQGEGRARTDSTRKHDDKAAGRHPDEEQHDTQVGEHGEGTVHQPKHRADLRGEGQGRAGDERLPDGAVEVC